MADEIPPGPPAWTRHTAWRQGSVLTREAAVTCGVLSDNADPAEVVVVVSHDCDLTSDDLDAEPAAEVIAGRTVATAHGNYTHAKAPRTLHWSVNRVGTECVLELVATRKVLVPKPLLAAFSPDPGFSLQPRSLLTLRRWLGVRYNRGAFPDTFVNRMKAADLTDRMSKHLEPAQSLISVVYIDLKDAQQRELAAGEVYPFNVLLVFAPGKDPLDAQDQAEELAEALADKLVKRLVAKGGPTVTGLQLGNCIAISEDELTLSQSRVFQQWQLEHLSLRDRSDEPLLPPA